MAHSVKSYPGARKGEFMYYYENFKLHRFGDLTMLRAAVKDSIECIHMTDGLGKKCNYKLHLIESPNQVIASVLVVCYGGLHN
jgi:hypothetical protein